VANGLTHSNNGSGIHKLSDKQQNTLIADLASFQKPTELATKFNISVSTVMYYTKTHRDLIKQSRRKWMTKLESEQYSHKRSRVIKLTQLIDMAEEIASKDDNSNIKLKAIQRIESIVDKIRIELEGNKLTVQGNITHTQTDSDLISKAAEILQGRIDAQVIE